ncbi:MAG: LysM peptidoglycan-binding domain-containing protein [Chloroflexi bacterium]|nr:LysM peptidoglycan-binding domain-containing protein [Chloroflexota bacterium]
MFVMLVSLVVLVFGTPEPAHAQAGTPNEVLAEINGLRIANGLEPLVENLYLTLAAQNHADWIAATRQGGHTGAGGSTPADRALAVGYGGGARVSVTENWARGPGLDAHSCVYDSWAPSSAHINNMLTTWHNEFGAGVALDSQGMTVYVVKFGHELGGSTPSQPTTVPSGPASTPATPAPLVQPIATAKPNTDDSVIHVVQFGQTLWGIAEAYQINMVTLLEQNYLTEDSAIYVNQELLIVPARVENKKDADVTRTPTEVATPTSTSTATRTPWPTRTAISVTPTPESNQPGEFFINVFRKDTLGVGIGLVTVSLFGIALLWFTSSRLK